MASLTIKGIPEELLEALRARAERERRSVNQQAIYVLEQALLSRHGSFLERLERFYAEEGPPAAGDEDLFEDVRSRDPGREPDL